MLLLNGTLLIIACGILIPTTVFCAQCLLSVILCRFKKTRLPESEHTTVVLIPAHNEAASIRGTLQSVLPTLRENDRILVIADNCTDDTAAIAGECGAEVCERHDLTRRGKPFALQFGLEQLKDSPPDVVVFLDADCRVEPETVARLSTRAHHLQRPAQGLNLAYADKTDGPAAVVSELAFRFKNLVRPLGFSRLGLPCHLMGTGMAMPWNLLKTVQFDGEHLAEDMQLGIDVALHGRAAVFCPEAAVSSPLAGGRSAFVSQRTRWEQGHLRTSLSNVPRLFIAGLLKFRPSLLFLAMDLTVPPLSLLVTVLVASLTGCIFAVLLGASWLPATLLGAGAGGMLLALLLGWAVFCRKQIPFASLLSIPWYVVRKIPIYLRFFGGRREKEWVRTEREPADREFQFPLPGERVAAGSQTRRPGEG